MTDDWCMIIFPTIDVTDDDRLQSVNSSIYTQLWWKPYLSRYCNKPSASIRTSELDPWLILETRLLLNIVSLPQKGNKLSVHNCCFVTCSVSSIIHHEKTNMLMALAQTTWVARAIFAAFFTGWFLSIVICLLISLLSCGLCLSFLTTTCTHIYINIHL